MGDSSIQWTNATWNMIRARNLITGQIGWHCELCSTGCVNCYAQQRNKGFFQLGTRLSYVRSSRDQVEIFIDEAALAQPLHWKKPKMIFVCSMTDLFGEWHTDEMIDHVFAVIAEAYQHKFQILTKRAKRMMEYFAHGDRPWQIAKAGKMPVRKVDNVWPLPNAWLGVSCENQKTADERIPHLLNTPAAVRFLSVEPQIDAINLPLAFCANCFRFVGFKLVNNDKDYGCVHCGCYLNSMGAGNWPGTFHQVAPLDWVIVGGESGPRARPFNVEWARAIIAQCKAAGVACFVKQLGAYPFDGYLSNAEVIGGGKGRPRPVDQPMTEEAATAIIKADRLLEEIPRYLNLKDRKGGEMSEWPEDLRVRQFPKV